MTTIEYVVTDRRAFVGRKASHLPVLMTAVQGRSNASGKIFDQNRKK